MFEFEIYNERTQEYNYIFGYNEKDAWRRNPNIDRTEWTIVHAEYID